MNSICFILSWWRFFNLVNDINLYIFKCLSHDFSKCKLDVFKNKVLKAQDNVPALPRLVILLLTKFGASYNSNYFPCQEENIYSKSIRTIRGNEAVYVHNLNKGNKTYSSWLDFGWGPTNFLFLAKEEDYSSMQLIRISMF